MGHTACRDCFKEVLEFLAERPDSPVTVVDGVEPREEQQPDPNRPRLGELPEIVVTAPGTTVYHAPDERGSDDAACFIESDKHRRAEREVLEPHGEPCKHCFEDGV
jgi:hypothetical protein